MAVTDNVIHSGTAPDTTLAADITSGSTTITITSGTGYASPTGGQISYITLAKATSAEELVSYTGRSGTSLTGCIRGLGGTSAAAHLAGVSVYHGWTAIEADDANTAVRNTVGKVTTAGDTLVATAAGVFKRLAIGAAYKALGVNAAGTDLTYLDTLASLLTAQGDVPYASAANTPARLAKGTGWQVFAMNNGATAPAYAAGFPGFVFADATARDAAITTPIKGMAAWLTGTGTIARTVYDGTAWRVWEVWGTGSPESAITATVGAMYHRTDGGASTSLYVKESGTGNTGWIAYGVSAATLPANDTAVVATDQTTSSTSFTDLATVGPAVTVVTGTKALVIVTCKSMNQTSLSVAEMGFAVSGATTIAANDPQVLYHKSPAASGAEGMSAAFLVTGLTAGSNTFTAKYRAQVSGTAEFLDRNIAVINLA